MKDCGLKPAVQSRLKGDWDRFGQGSWGNSVLRSRNLALKQVIINNLLLSMVLKSNSYPHRRELFLEHFILRGLDILPRHSLLTVVKGRSEDCWDNLLNCYRDSPQFSSLKREVG